MINDLFVKVERYRKSNTGIEVFDGFFISKVFAYDRYASKFLVYDDGSCSKEYEDTGICDGFRWVGITDKIPSDVEGVKIPMLTLVSGGEGREEVERLIDDIYLNGGSIEKKPRGEKAKEYWEEGPWV